jgi:hypothetical protein
MGESRFFTYLLYEHGGGGGGGGGDNSSDQQCNKRCKGRWLLRSIRYEDQRPLPLLFDSLVSRCSVAANWAYHTAPSLVTVTHESSTFGGKSYT